MRMTTRLITLAVLSGGMFLPLAQQPQTLPSAADGESPLSRVASSASGETLASSDVPHELLARVNDEGTDGSGDTSHLTGRFDTATPAFPGHEPGGTRSNDTRSVIDADGRLQVTTPNGLYAKVAYFEMSDRNWNSVGSCTGFLVGGSYLLTAGHCVHPGGTGSNKDFFPYFDVFPAYAGSLEPGGLRCFNENAWTHVSWINSSSTQHDWGLIKMSCNAGDVYGTFGLAVNDVPWSYYDGDSIMVLGYPGDKPQGTLWYDNDFVTWGYPMILRHTADTAAGQSGAPILKGPTAAAGIHAYGVGIFPDNFGMRIDQSLHDVVYGIIF